MSATDYNTEGSSSSPVTMETPEAPLPSPVTMDTPEAPLPSPVTMETPEAPLPSPVTMATPEVGQDQPDLMGSNIILSDNLPLYPNTNIPYKVTLTERFISWELASQQKNASKINKKSFKGKRSSSQESVSEDSVSSETRHAIIEQGGLFLLLDDIVGCDCMKGKTAQDKNAYFTIYAYPHKRKGLNKHTVRTRETITLTFINEATFEENFHEATKWRNVMMCLVRRQSVNTADDDLNTIEPKSKGKMLVLINPCGGKGKASKIFKERVVPLLAEAGIQYEEKVTEYAGHARELMKSLDMNTWYGILIVSGDGLIFEVINGLMDRSDAEEAIKIPLGVLPGGSGNALCAAIGFQAEEPYLDNAALHASFTIAKHITVPLDLVAVDTCGGRRQYSFLSCVWGIISDIDIETEKYRNLGEARFIVGAAVRILGLKKYRGRVSFLPIGPYVPPSKKNASTAAPETPNSSSQNEKAESVTEGTSDPTADIPSLDQPVPSNWVVIEDQFINIAAIYLSHLSKDFFGLASSRLNDGIIYLNIIRAGVSRTKLVKTMNAMGSGKYAETSDIEVVPVKAFRIEPDDKDGIMTVDGERVEFGPMQGQMLALKANVMAQKKGHFASS